MKIANVEAYEILDSRGNPTIEAEVYLEDGSRGRGAVPSGASTGQFEALELRDDDPNRFSGLGVGRAIQNVYEKIRPAIIGMDATDQLHVDQVLIDLDGTPTKSKLGANSILSVSMAVASAAAAARKLPLFAHLGGQDATLLPLPQIQIIGGGVHANRTLDVQDFLVVALAASAYAETLEVTHRVYRATDELLRSAGKRYGVADEGGYWPAFATNEEPIELLVRAIERAGYRPGGDVAIALDIAANELYDANTGRYCFRLEGREFTSDGFAALIHNWCQRYPIVSIEDPMADTDLNGWQAITCELASSVQIVGDDLFTTNVERIQEGVRRNLANAALIKLNQVGTVSETLKAIEVTQHAGWRPIVSARSGETEDSFISHLAVATNAGQIKVGSITRGERTAKWNELLRIERQLGDRAIYTGGAVIPAAASKMHPN
jgi:enolase